MQKDTLSVSNVIDRLVSPTPPFWKKVRKIGLWITGAAGIVVAASGAGLVLPAVVLTAAKIIGAVSTASVIQAQATKTDSDATADTK
ncbi:hypothetical protein DYU05_03905 [Mucilaginibacter terrenus]|uniref:Transmembrane protein n=1 Tax=Mucilaginibacter terrenus TaxID=2482727 RepID=A0A3E2NUW0_9SPHI|nr:hypothetical protein [Mucilaginibacter terrenus]RFZ84759.1 hypothetical protein DYU05_03905 [Mucilaginibacter terrenus]